MTLRSALERILVDFPQAREKSLRDNPSPSSSEGRPLARLRRLLGRQWATVPWNPGPPMTELEAAATARPGRRSTSPTSPTGRPSSPTARRRPGE